MGKIKKGVLGGFIGTVGTLVGSCLRGESIVKTKKSNLKVVNNVSGQSQNLQFIQSNNFYNQYGNILNQAIVALGLDISCLRQSVFAGSHVYGLAFEGSGFKDGLIKTKSPVHINKKRLGFYTAPDRLNIRFNLSNYLNIQNPHCQAYYSVQSSMGTVSYVVSKHISVVSTFFAQSTTVLQQGESLIMVMVIKSYSGVVISNILYCSYTRS